jgi:hypothetical protein
MLSLSLSLPITVLKLWMITEELQTRETCCHDVGSRSSTAGHDTAQITAWRTCRCVRTSADAIARVRIDGRPLTRQLSPSGRRLQFCARIVRVEREIAGRMRMRITPTCYRVPGYGYVRPRAQYGNKHYTRIIRAYTSSGVHMGGFRVKIPPQGQKKKKENCFIIDDV